MEHASNDGADSPALSSLQRRRKSRAMRLSDGAQAEALSLSVTSANSETDCVTRASWFQDAFQQQGLSDKDMQEFLAQTGGSGAVAHEGENQHDDESDFDTTGIGGASISLPMDEMAEQHKFMAMHEAKKLLDQNVGYDVAEAAKKVIEQAEEERPSKPSPNTAIYSCYPEKPIYTVSLRNSTEQQRSFSKRRMQPKFDVPVADFSRTSLLGRVAPKHKVAYGTVVDNSEDDWNAAATTDEEEDCVKILSHCERCKVLLAVPFDALLALCPKCHEPIH